MKSTVLFAFMFLVSFSNAFSQETKKLLINSGDLIDKGVAAYDDGEYKRAIDFYKQVTRNDTNYVFALNELGITYLADSQFAEAVAVCQLGLKNPEGQEYHFYTTLGSAYDELKQTDKSIEAFQKGLTFAPYDYNIWYNLGVTYEKTDKEKSANAYKMALKYNPFHSSSLYRLGALELEKGHTVTAMMSFYMSLICTPGGKYIEQNITGLEDISKVKLKLTNGGSSRRGDNFYELELMLASKIALSDKFKNQAKFDDPVVNQTQLLIDKLIYNPSDTGYFMRTYVPYFNQIRDKGMFTPFIYQAFSALNSDKVQAGVKKNQTAIAAFRTWTYTWWDEKRGPQTIIENGVAKKVTFWFSNINKLQAIGEFKDPKATVPLRTGVWTFYYDNGNKEYDAFYNQNGERDGEWKAYTYNGILSEILHYKNDKLNGLYEEYYSNGQLSTTCTFADGNIEGLITIYDEAGNLKIERMMKKGVQDGLTKEYFRNGSRDSELKLVNGDFQGVQMLYYDNGKVKKKITYAEGKITGPYENYYKNGQLESKGMYAFGEMTGVWLSYYETGALYDSGAYNNQGSNIGKWVQYHDNGVIERISMYDAKGKKQGEHKEFDTDGKLYCSYVYLEGKISEYTFYNKSGTVVSSAKEKAGVLLFKSFYPDGKTLRREGTYKNGLQEGEWKNYSRNNYLESKEIYLNGELSGVSIYYYSTGVTEKEIAYKKGEPNGYYRSYYKNKQLYEEGNYVDGLKQGYWLGYYPNGNKSFEYYYLDDVQERYNIDYTVRGFKDAEDYYEFGFVKQRVIYDSLGKVLSTSTFIRGNGEHKSLYPNGKTRSTYTQKNGVPEGVYTRYYSNGKLAEKSTYVKGYRQGPVEVYEEDGSLAVKGAYEDDERTGKWTYYYPNGVIETVGYYKAGYKDSLWIYYTESGRKSDQGYWKKGDIDGTYTYFSPDTDESIFIREFVKDFILYYTYTGKDGKPIAPIPVINETVDFKSFYSTGTPAIQYSLKGGAREGIFLRYYSNGQKFEEFTYLTGEKNGRQVVYYSTGKIMHDDNYLYDEKDGTCKSYYPNGTIKSIEQYVYGEFNGTCQYFDSTGKLTKTVLYRDGIIYSKL